MKRTKRPIRSDITRKALSEGMTAVRKTAETKAFSSDGTIIYLEGDAIVRRSKDGKKDIVSSHSSSAQKVTLEKKVWKI